MYKLLTSTGLKEQPAEPAPPPPQPLMEPVAEPPPPPPPTMEQPQAQPTQPTQALPSVVSMFEKKVEQISKEELKMRRKGKFHIMFTVNFLNIRTPKIFVVITLKFELYGSTIE